MKTTKTFLLVLMTFSLVYFSSCESDDNNGGGKGSDLIGKWTIDDSEVSVTVEGVDFVTYLVESMGMTQEQAEMIAGFMTGGTGSAPTGTITFNEDGTYSAMVDGDAESGTWSLSSDGKVLTISGTDEDGSYSDELMVESLTSSKLVLVLAEETEDVDMDDDGVDETTLEYNMKLILVK
jgi:hypothetical protein